MHQDMSNPVIAIRFFPWRYDLLQRVAQVKTREKASRERSKLAAMRVVPVVRRSRRPLPENTQRHDIGFVDRVIGAVGGCH
jgi:hypothetical protein